MGLRSYLSSYETVSINNKTVDLQRDIISTLTPAVSISRLDFASLILVETSVERKILLLAKFRCFTTDPDFQAVYGIDILMFKHFIESIN